MFVTRQAVWIVQSYPTFKKFLRVIDSQLNIKESYESHKKKMGTESSSKLHRSPAHSTRLTLQGKRGLTGLIYTEKSIYAPGDVAH